MAISTGYNINFGGPLVTQKYKPLEPTLRQEDRPDCDWLLTNRTTLLTASGLRGPNLILAVPNWNAATLAEAGRLPPLVVVSSGRAGWIRTGIDGLTDLGLNANAPECDAQALAYVDGPSAPLYAPLRIGANRSVYVVVHLNEYTFYRKTLAGINGITPVGWAFTGKAARGVSLTGFGASRYAAIEFCKTLRRAATPPGGVAPWNFAWLLDDNLVALNEFAGFAAVEAALQAAGPNTAAAGFTGGTVADTTSGVRSWANGVVAEQMKSGQVTKPLRQADPPGIIQQGSLWNIAYLDANFLNFGPVFMASAEDLSLSAYLDAAGIPYLYYSYITTIKELAEADASPGLAKLKAARSAMEAWVTTAENQQSAHPPPPVYVSPTTGPPDKTLAGYLLETVLPNAAQLANRHSPAVQNTAKAQAVEQLTSGAIRAGILTAQMPSVTQTFYINDNRQQPVDARSIP